MLTRTYLAGCGGKWVTEDVEIAFPPHEETGRQHGRRGNRLEGMARTGQVGAASLLRST
jgi:hypothetical protein